MNKKYLRKIGCMLLIVFFCCACSGGAEETLAEGAVQDAEAAGTENTDDDPAAAGAENGGDDPAATGTEAVSSNSEAASGESVSDNSAAEVAPKSKVAPVKVKGIYVSGPVAGTDRMDELIALVEETELNTLVIDIKNDEGRVTYKMQSDRVLEIDAGVRYIPDIEELVRKCKEKNIYLIARIVAFRDPYLAEQKPELAVKTKSGEVFRDEKGLAWVNPYKKEVWEYLVEIAAEAANAGFDEVQFDYIRFSTDIAEQEADYGPEAANVSKIEVITDFTEYLYEKLSPLGVYVAADVFGTVIDNETDQKIVGQDYAKMAAHLDYICPMIYPSHYYSGSYGIPVPDAEPYRTIYEASSASVKALDTVPEEERAKVRVWLQSFTAKWVEGHISYGPVQIRAQIKGAYHAGYEEWILWNASMNYQADAFLTEEEAEAERQQWEIEKSAPGTTVSENSMPETTVSENGVPGTMVSENGTPETTVSENSAPEVNIEQ